MRSFFDWFEEECKASNRPWLILGKGPSFARRKQFQLDQFHLLSLNHVVREQSVTAAHIIDLDVLDACVDAVVENAAVLVMPWVPHVKNYPGPHDLGRLARTHPVLRKMEAQGRLLWYNLKSSPRRREGSPVIRARFFSAEAALDLLAKAGAPRVRSLGIDGGDAYSPDFSDLKDTTRLNNGLRSYDAQFEEIAAILLSIGVDYAPLDEESPIRIYVGTAEEQMLPFKVLEYSIRKHATMSVKVHPLHLSGVQIPEPRDPRNRPRTPFSFQRLLVPQLAGRRGRAIYLDSDMLVFRDIRALWSMPFEGADVLSVGSSGGTRDPQFSVMVLDCAKLDWEINDIVQALDAGNLTYKQLIYELSVARNPRASIPPTWNSMERYKAGETALLHYTDMPAQPWLSKEHALGHLWFKHLFEAIDAGFISEDFIRDQVEKGFVRPSLLHQVRHRLHDSILLPREARALDKGFIPPHRRAVKLGRAPFLRPAAWMHAALRHGYYRSPLPRLIHRIRTKLMHQRLWSN